MDKEDYTKIAKTLIYLKDIKNYSTISRGFFTNAPNFAGYHVDLSKIFKFNAVAVFNIDKEYTTTSRVVTADDNFVLSLNLYKMDVTVQNFVNNLEKFVKVLEPLLEDLIQKKAEFDQAGNGQESKYNTPYGYTRTAEGSLEVDKKEAEVVRNIYRLYNKHKSMNHVTYLMQRIRVKSRSGTLIDLSVISNILHDQRYLKIKPSIVPASTFKQTQSILLRNKKEKGIGRRFN